MNQRNLTGQKAKKSRFASAIRTESRNVFLNRVQNEYLKALSEKDYEKCSVLTKLFYFDIDSGQQNKDQLVVTKTNMIQLDFSTKNVRHIVVSKMFSNPNVSILYAGKCQSGQSSLCGNCDEPSHLHMIVEAKYGLNMVVKSNPKLKLYKSKSVNSQSEMSDIVNSYKMKKA